jgi:hypothetical protein
VQLYVRLLRFTHDYVAQEDKRVVGKLVLLLAVPLLYLLVLIVKRLTRKTNPNRTRAEGGLVILKALDTPPDWLINNITEASKNARQIYFIYIIFIMYAVLVIISTSDENIVLNRSAHLPIINVNIPLNGFYILSPIIAIFIFVYFQLYLFKIKYLIDDLRVKYLKVEERRLYPWMLNIADYPEKGVIGIIQTAIGKISIWCLLPIFLSVVTIWYIKRHDPLLPYIFSTGTILITFITICFWYYFDFEVNFSLSGFIKKNYIKIMIFLAIIIPHLLLITKVIPSANKGDDIKYLKNWIMIDLSYQKLSIQPEQDVEESFLIKSKLYCSELQSSENPYSINLEGTHLEGADLTSTNLRQANLGKAHLQKAHMSKAVLERANLEEANLQQAVLFGVNLQKACLKNANLQNAHPWLAILRGADLE